MATSSASSYQEANISVIPDEAAVAESLAEQRNSARKLANKVDIPCCSICLDETKREKVRTVCTCHRLVHLSCLEKWLEASRSNRCEICKHTFTIRIEKRYTKPMSVIVWLTRVHSKKAFLSDLLQFITIGFMISLGIFIIIRSFTEQTNIDMTSRFVSAFGAAIMVLIIGAAFVVCCFAAFRQYRAAWYNWYVQCNKVSIMFTPTDSQCLNLNAPPCFVADVPDTRILSDGPTEYTTLCVFGL